MQPYDDPLAKLSPINVSPSLQYNIEKPENSKSTTVLDNPPNGSSLVMIGKEQSFLP